MSTISINGKTYFGNSVNVTNGKVIVDGKEYNPSDNKIINIIVEGNITSLEVDYCKSLKIVGHVGRIRNGSGDVEITGNVTGDVQTGSGEVTIKAEVNGNVQTGSGDVQCGDIMGSVKTGSGDIKTIKR